VRAVRALVVFESMYGNTRAVAEAIADGLRSSYDVELRPVVLVGVDDVAAADLLVVGGPTHVRGLASPTSRKGAYDAVERSGGELVLDPSFVESDGLREWLGRLHAAPGTPAAAFDTRLEGPALITGRASKAIAHRLRRTGYTLVVAPESFLVTKAKRLAEGERDRAGAWAGAVVTALRPPH
jgi:hypothetical protein